MKLAVWIAGALALGWLLTAVAAVVGPEGHPPSWYFVGGAVVLLSFPLAPIGVGASLLTMWRVRRHAGKAPPVAIAALGVNALFLVVAISLWLFFLWAASRR